MDDRIAELEKRTEELERLVQTLSTSTDISPDVLNAIANPLTSTASGAYDGHFKINGKIVGYYNP